MSHVTYMYDAERQIRSSTCQNAHCNTLQHTATHCNTLQHMMRVMSHICMTQSDTYEAAPVKTPGTTSQKSQVLISLLNLLHKITTHLTLENTYQLQSRPIPPPPTSTPAFRWILPPHRMETHQLHPLQRLLLLLLPY